MEDFNRRAVNVQVINSCDFVLQRVISAFEISLELLLLLIPNPLVISWTFYFIVNMFERFISSGYTLGPVQDETNVPNSEKKLVILSSPTPEVIRHSVHLFEIVMRKHEDATDVVGVVIFWMKFWRSDMNRAVRRVFVFYLMSLRYQVDIVHRDVVNLSIKRMQKSSIYKRSTVESITIDLIDNNYLMSYISFVEKSVHSRSEFHQLIKSVPKWHDYREFMTSRSLFQRTLDHILFLDFILQLINFVVLLLLMFDYFRMGG